MPRQRDPEPILVEILDQEGGIQLEQWVIALLPLLAAFAVLFLGQRHERRKEARAERLTAYADLLDQAAAVQAQVVISLEGQPLRWDVWIPANGALNAAKERAKMLTASSHKASVESSVEDLKDRLRNLLSESRAADHEIERLSAIVANRRDAIAAASDSEVAAARAALQDAEHDLGDARYAYEEKSRASFATFAGELESVARVA